MVQNFSGYFGWNGKRGIRLRISIFFGNFPVENELYHLDFQRSTSSNRACFFVTTSISFIYGNIVSFRGLKDTPEILEIR